MISIPLFKKLHKEGLLPDTTFEKIREAEAGRLFSVYWELNTLLYLGVLLLTSGLGILVYKNIDTIGHQAILTLIALLSASCFYYCFKKKLPFSYGKIASPNPAFDYILLLGCLCFLIFIAYLQYQFQVFGSRYGLATFIPMVLLFLTAYFFDHLGILSMAITSFAAWMGISVTPLRMLQSNDFNNSRIIFTGIAIGVLLLAAAWTTKKRKIKTHFEFTYNNFGTNILFVSLLAALFHFDSIFLLFFVVLAGFAGYSYFKALRENTYYFFLITVLYGYIGLSYVIVRLLILIPINIFSTALYYFGMFYFIASATWLVSFLIKTNKNLKEHDSLQ